MKENKEPMLGIKVFEQVEELKKNPVSLTQHTIENHQQYLEMKKVDELREKLDLLR